MFVRRTPLQSAQMAGSVIYPRQVAPTIASTAQKLEDQLLGHTRLLKRLMDVVVDFEPHHVQKSQNVEQPKVGPKEPSSCGIAS